MGGPSAAVAALAWAIATAFPIHLAQAQETGAIRSAADGSAASGGHSGSAPTSRGRGGRPAAAASSEAILPGFELLADGSTRLFVELSRPVAYETKIGRGTITYVLKGARIERKNNRNPLVTVHFNTPVTSARLVPHGHDVWFTVALRSAVRPAVTMDAGKNGGAMMRIEFPKGDYVSLGAPPRPGAGPSGGASDGAPPDRSDP